MTDNRDNGFAAQLLEGVKVLDLSGVGPGARCSRLFADFGADVVRVAPPRQAGGHRLSAPFYGYGGARGWQTLGVDLKSERGVDVVKQLAHRADVVVEGFRPGVADRLGVGYDSLSAENPQLVYASVTGYGSSGPNAHRAGHDINYVSVAGAVPFDHEDTPVLPALSVADAAGGGMHAAVAVLAALHSSTRTGQGQWLDVSMTHGMLYLMSLPVDEFLATGAENGPSTAMLSGAFACYGFYQTADEKWLAVGAIESGFFRNLCTVLECPEWIPEQLTLSRQDEIRHAFQNAFRRRNRDDWLDLFANVDACVTPVNDMQTVVEDAQFANTDSFVTAHHPEHGTFQQTGFILAGMGSGSDSEVVLGDSSSNDASKVLHTAGFSESIAEELIREGVVS